MTDQQKELEQDRLKEREEFLTFEIKRCKNLLENKNFVQKASKEKVALEKEKLQNFQKELQEIQIILKRTKAKN